MKANTQTVTIAAPRERVYAFVANPENLPRWAIGFAKAVRREATQWIVVTQSGDMPIDLVTDADHGVIDFMFQPTAGVTVTACSRVIANGETAEYVFTQFQDAGMPDEVFEEQVRALGHELDVLRAHCEVDCPW
jgi:hypothetical protein